MVARIGDGITEDTAKIKLQRLKEARAAKEAAQQASAVLFRERRGPIRASAEATSVRKLPVTGSRAQAAGPGSMARAGPGSRRGSRRGSKAALGHERLL